MTCLETAANPYIAALGNPEDGAGRLNLAQSLNGLGWIVGPLIGGVILFSDGGEADIALPYLLIGCVVVLVAILFMRVKLPEIKKDALEGEGEVETSRGLWQHPHFAFGVLALFCYVAAQTGINSFFINYATESSVGLSNRQAALLLSFGGMGLFMVGRFLGSWCMNHLRAERLLSCFAAGASLCMLGVIFCSGWSSLAALFTCYLFESIMFPTIFALAIYRMEQHTERASSFLIMSIVGGAIAPVLMGVCGEDEMRHGFVIPLVCFGIIMAYALRYRSLLVKNR